MSSWKERQSMLEQADQANLRLAKELQQYENIEKGFGIKLTTLSKALVCFYAKDLDCYCPHPVGLYKTCGEDGEWMITWLGHDYRLKDYEKTWALSRKELR